MIQILYFAGNFGRMREYFHFVKYKIWKTQQEQPHTEIELKRVEMKYENISYPQLGVLSCLPIYLFPK